jgi:hypothetical protein
MKIRSFTTGVAAPADTSFQVDGSGAGRLTGRTTATASQAITPVTNAHGMCTRGKDGVCRPIDRMNLQVTPVSPVPSLVRSALSDPA